VSLKAMQLQLKAATLIATNIVAENEKNIKAAVPEMIRLNHEQLDEGILNTGKQIEPEYSPSYANFKGFDIPDLNLTGAFRRGWDVVVDDKELLFGSNDEKTKRLVDKYTVEIFGLTKENAEFVFNKINTKRNNYVDKITKRYY
jgi:hypothetical protein